jgi:hypothetical protein
MKSKPPVLEARQQQKHLLTTDSDLTASSPQLVYENMWVKSEPSSARNPACCSISVTIIIPLKEEFHFSKSGELT